MFFCFTGLLDGKVSPINSSRDLWRKVLLWLVNKLWSFFSSFFLFFSILAPQQTHDIPPLPNSTLLKNTERRKMLSEACEKQGFSFITEKASWLVMNSESNSYTSAAIPSRNKILLSPWKKYTFYSKMYLASWMF